MSGLGAAERLGVRYRSTDTVYLDGGRSAGLAEGDRLEVLEGETVVAVVEVTYLAEQSASCKLVSEVGTVKAGQAVRPLKPAVVPAPTASPLPPTTPASPEPGPAPARTAKLPLWGRAFGGISIGYYKAIDDTPSALDFEQRTLRADITLVEMAGRPLTFSARFRSRQDIRAQALSLRTPQNQRVDRLYELSLRYDPPNQRFAAEVGRLGTSHFTSIGALDGALVRVGLFGPVQAGGFFGRRVEIDSFSAPGGGNKYGGFLRVAPGGRWGSQEVQLAYIREDAAGDVSREYLSLESRFRSGSKLSIFERAELDLNNGWRSAVTSSQTQLTNVSISVNYRFTRQTSLQVAYDGRRTYRDYFNRNVPENVFDELLHQGFRATLSHAKPQGLFASVGGGYRLREGDESASYSAFLSLNHPNLFGTRLLVGLDGSGFRNITTEGVVANARVGKRFGAGHQIDLLAGGTLYRVRPTSEDRRTEWLRFMTRFELGHGVSLTGDAEYDLGDDLKGPRGLIELAHRF